MAPPGEASHEQSDQQPNGEAYLPSTAQPVAQPGAQPIAQPGAQPGHQRQQECLAPMLSLFQAAPETLPGHHQDLSGNNGRWSRHEQLADKDATESPD